MNLSQYDELLQRAEEARTRADSEGAYDYYARATELDPNRAEGWRGRAATSTLPEDAFLSLSYAVALDPADGARRFDFLQQLQARASSAAPGDVPTLLLLGRRVAQVGMLKEAQLLFRRALELDPDNVDALKWKAATTNDAAESSAALERARALNPNDVLIRAGIDAAHAQTQRESAAARAPKVESTPSDGATDLVREGTRLLGQGNKSAAHALFVHATAISPRNEDAWLGRARATDDLDEALTCLDQALAINPDNMQAREARTYNRVRKLREGVKKPGTAPEPTPARAFAGGGAFRATQDETVRQRRVLLLVLMLMVLALMLLVLYVRLTP